MRLAASDIRSSALTLSNIVLKNLASIERLPRAGTPKDLGHFQDSCGTFDSLCGTGGRDSERAGR